MRGGHQPGCQDPHPVSDPSICCILAISSRQRGRQGQESGGLLAPGQSWELEENLGDQQLLSCLKPEAVTWTGGHSEGGNR